MNIEDMKIDYQDRIDEYLLDRMSDEERKSFESDAAEDAARNVEPTGISGQVMLSRFKRVSPEFFGLPLIA